VKRDRENMGDDKILSLTKLKTLEYVLFMKMREKLRNFISGKSRILPDAIQERFIKETKDLVKGFKLPHPIDYYVDIFCSAFSMVTRGTN
jgi:hypothetical protein